MSKVECCYCGQIAKNHRDHVPPKVLFKKPRPANLITVPACATCNGGFSKNDEYFANILALEDHAHAHPDAKARAAAVFRNLERQQAKGSRAALGKSIVEAAVYSRGGIYLGQRTALRLDFARIRATLNRCAKGLFFAEFGHRIPDSREVLSFSISDLEPEEFGGLAKTVRAVLATPARDDWRGVFRYWVRLASDADDVGGFVIEFYKAKAFFCGIVPAGSVDSPTPRAVQLLRQRAL